MTPFRQRLAEIDWKEAGAFIGVLLVVAGFARMIGRWVKRRIILPPITEALRAILKDDLEKIHNAAIETERLATSVMAVTVSVSSTMQRVVELDAEMDVIWGQARLNRERVNETGYLLDRILSIERRQPSDDSFPERRPRTYLTPLPDDVLRLDRGRKAGTDE